MAEICSFFFCNKSCVSMGYVIVFCILYAKRMLHLKISIYTHDVLFEYHINMAKIWNFEVTVDKFNTHMYLKRFFPKIRHMIRKK